jgi:PAS domain-containing protein
VADRHRDAAPRFRVVAGSEQRDFPTDIERLLLRVATNQAGIGLQEARRSGEQKRVAAALEQQVAERTTQLQGANEELRHSETELRQLIDVIPQQVVVFDSTQPIAAVLTDANTCLRWLTRDHANMEEAREAASKAVKGAKPAADIITRIRLLFTKGTAERSQVQVPDA